jgi:glyoxylase-like metal-dependent hydrolase (beta-lactamase superfamily II)
MEILNRLNNIFVIDTKMFDLDHYNAAYLVVGKEIALIDTGLPSKLEVVRAAIKSHGFQVSDISYIFITHCEHSDHSGNVGPLLRETRRAQVFINPLGLEFLTNPRKERAVKQGQVTPEMYAKSGDPEPVPVSRICFLKDGDVFNLGDGEKLQVCFAPGHQPGGIVLRETKNNGLFINDLVGNCFPDSDAHYALNPFRSNHFQAIQSLRKLSETPVDYLFLGHFGISDRPRQVIERAIKNMQTLLDMGRKCVLEGKPEEIGQNMIDLIMPELEKIRKVRGPAIYEYASRQHIPSQAKLFTRFCREAFSR